MTASVNVAVLDPAEFVAVSVMVYSSTLTSGDTVIVFFELSKLIPEAGLPIEWYTSMVTEIGSVPVRV